MATINRRSTVTSQVGNVRIGANYPIVVQSMTNTDTADIAATVAQVAALARAGSELVRVTVNTREAAAAVPEIVDRLRGDGLQVPITSCWPSTRAAPRHSQSIESIREMLGLESGTMKTSVP